ncbi:MAG: 1-phosphofructokinase family hexose kinase [Gemmatimonadota bacterium]
MRPIVTLTVNPAIDMSTRAERVEPDRKLRCARPRRDPGGGGINVARAVRRLGGASTAVHLAGGRTGAMLRDLLDRERVDQRPVRTEASTRENVIVREESTGRQYRFGMPGAEVGEEEGRRCLEVLAALAAETGWLVASGSLAPGVGTDFYGRVADLAADTDARLVVDTSGPALRAAVEAGVYLIKPNVREFHELVGREFENDAERVAEARRLIERGRCRAIVISLGAGGAQLVTAERAEFVRSPTVPIRSRVGAGDSTVAGIVLGLARGMELARAVRLGVAAGAAAVMTDGTELCRREDTERLFGEITGDD